MALFGKKKSDHEKLGLRRDKDRKEDLKEQKAQIEDTPNETSSAAKKTPKRVLVLESKGNNIRTHNPSGVLLRPRITEKATFAQEKRAYVFEVQPRATKKDIVQAILYLYKVKPIKVNITKIPSKKRESQMRRTRGVKSGGKKAYVYLKEGDSIELV